MKIWAVTEEQQTLRIGEEGKGEMSSQSHGHSADDRDEVLRDKLDKETRHTACQNSPFSTFAQSN